MSPPRAWRANSDAKVWWGEMIGTSWCHSDFVRVHATTRTIRWTRLGISVCRRMAVAVAFVPLPGGAAPARFNSVRLTARSTAEGGASQKGAASSTTGPSPPHPAAAPASVSAPTSTLLAAGVIVLGPSRGVPAPPVRGTGHRVRSRASTEHRPAWRIDVGQGRARVGQARDGMGQAKRRPRSQPRRGWRARPRLHGAALSHCLNR